MADAAVAQLGLNLRVSDVTGQNRFLARDIEPDKTVGEVVRQLVPRMGLSSRDSNGRDLAYHVRAEREGRHLHAAEIVGEVLREGDEIVLQPNIDAALR